MHTIMLGYISCLLIYGFVVKVDCCRYGASTVCLSLPVIRKTHVRTRGVCPVGERQARLKKVVLLEVSRIHTRLATMLAEDTFAVGIWPKRNGVILLHVLIRATTNTAFRIISTNKCALRA